MECKTAAMRLVLHSPHPFCEMDSMSLSSLHCIVCTAVCCNCHHAKEKLFLLFRMARKKKFNYIPFEKETKNVFIFFTLLSVAHITYVRSIGKVFSTTTMTMRANEIFLLRFLCKTPFISWIMSSTYFMRHFISFFARGSRADVCMCASTKKFPIDLKR
jgi:hypothetical protein